MFSGGLPRGNFDPPSVRNPAVDAAFDSVVLSGTVSDAEALDELKLRDALMVEIPDEAIEGEEEVGTKTPEELEAELNANIAALGAA